MNDTTTPPDQDVEIVMLSPDEVQRRMQEGKAVVYDVREPNEYEEYRIRGAILHPLSELNSDEIRAPEGKDLILHCRSARRCGIAADQMVAEGYRGKIYRMAGGILAWVEAGLPVDRGAAG